MTLAVEVAGKTDIGCVRTNNEDNFGYDSRYGIFVVCDGMGGQAAGEVASKIGVDSLLQYFRQHRARTANGNGTATGSSSKALAAAIDVANRSIYDAGHEQIGRSGMGSTVVAALLHGRELAIGHVGDSRIYLLHEKDRLREWFWTVPAPVALDPGAEDPKEIAAAAKAADKRATAQKAAEIVALADPEGEG